MTDAPRLSDQLCFALHAASRAVVQAYQPVLAPLGITYLQYLVLLLLWERDDRRVKDLGEALELDSGTLTPLLGRLESRGLVRRHRESGDRRQVRVRLTTEGETLREAASDVPRALLCRYGVVEGDARARSEVAALKAALDGLRTRLRVQPDAETPTGPTSKR